MQDLQIDFHPPDDILSWTKAFLDSGAAVMFIVVLIVVIYARKRYPVMERNRTFLPMLLFALFGVISTIMDAIDEFYWFTPKAFYDYIWKPTRLSLFIIGIFILVIAFYQFYEFSQRLFGEES
jgi:hypothetical protein